MASWWTFDPDSGDAWYPSSDSKGIENAFRKGEATFDDGNYKYLFPLMLAVKGDIEAYVVRKPADDDSSHPWQFEHTYGKYVPMSQHMSSTLSIARHAGYTKMCIRDESTFRLMEFDIVNMTQKNAETGTVRTITPASISCKVPESDYDKCPEHMVCPIYHTIMRDPVMAQDGHSYERNAIEHWFSTGKISSPLTGLAFITPRVYENIRLRHEIEEYKSMKNADQKFKVVTGISLKKRKRK